MAGEYIDLTLGVTFGISTMAAAALGEAGGCWVGGLIDWQSVVLIDGLIDWLFDVSVYMLIDWLTVVGSGLLSEF